MDTFLRNSTNEYLQKTDFTEDFANQNERIFNMLENLPVRATAEDILALLMPLIEIAWADEKISARETDAILLVAKSYGLTDHEETYAKLMNQISLRPTPKMLGRAWNRIHNLLKPLAPQKIEFLGQAILRQSEYVAEQSAANLSGYVRGEGVCADELSVLQRISEEFKKIKLAGERNLGLLQLGLPQNDTHSKNYPPFSAPDFEQLLPLVPLVKVAWAEGRITNRERQIVFAAAKRLGVMPKTESFQKLESWLELHPTDDFYNESLEYLKLSWANLPPEDKTLRRLDILSDCALIAEASGGTREFAAGGPRVCEEEFAAVKQVAEKLNANQVLVLN